MADIAPSGGRQLTELERQAFQRLGLTPGHWAALAPAPLFHRAGLRIPNRRSRADLEVTERLRWVLRSANGYSREAGHFWDRLGDVARRADAILATRLLAWHLATDLPFSRRMEYFQQLLQSAEHYAIRGTYNQHPQDAVQTFRRLVDAYLPYPAFVPDGDPPPVVVPVPTAGLLDAIGRTVQTPLIPLWSMTNTLDVPHVLSSLLPILGERVREWWGKIDPARRAAERGLASRPFVERWQLYLAVYDEWFRVLSAVCSRPTAVEFSQRFVTRMREWIDAVRRASRPVLRDPSREAVRAEPPPAAAALVPPVELPPPAPQPAVAIATPPAIVPPAAPPEALIEPLHPEFVRVPAAVRGLEPAPKPPVPPPPPPQPERVAVQVAERFTMVDHATALALASAVSVAEVCAWVDSNPRLLFDDCRDEASPAVAVVKTHSAVPPALWVVGDLHADVLTLANIIAFAEAHATPEQPAHFLFLGDFVDRGIHDHETLLLLFRLVMAHPQRVCVIPGNHDVDLQFSEAIQRFRVTIEPAEYCASLNTSLEQGSQEDRERVQLARAFIRFCAGRPRAVFMPDGTLFSHGGFPHTDVQKEIATLADLCRPKCVDDFLWARIAESARVKRPNRSSRGHEFGWDTFSQFCKLAAERLELPVRRLVRGHDHVTDRWQEYPDYADNGVPVLTVNAMGRLLDGEPARRDGRPHPFPALARWVPDHLPEVVLLPLDAAEVTRAFQRLPASSPPGAGESPVDRLHEPGRPVERGAEGVP